MRRIVSAFFLGAILATAGCGGAPENDIMEPSQTEYEKRKAQHQEQMQKMQEDMQKNRGKRPR